MILREGKGCLPMSSYTGSGRLNIWDTKNSCTLDAHVDLDGTSVAFSLDLEARESGADSAGCLLGGAFFAATASDGGIFLFILSDAQ